jgi:hypothetical protein
MAFMIPDASGQPLQLVLLLGKVVIAPAELADDLVVLAMRRSELLLEPINLLDQLVAPCVGSAELMLELADLRA